MDEPSDDFELEAGSENSTEAGSGEMHIVGDDDPSPDEDGTGLHTSEELMTEDWDNDSTWVPSRGGDTVNNRSF